MTDTVRKASVQGLLTNAERIQPVMNAVLAQIYLKADLFNKFMPVLKKVNPGLWESINQYYHCKH